MEEEAVIALLSTIRKSSGGDSGSISIASIKARLTRPQYFKELARFENSYGPASDKSLPSKNTLELMRTQLFKKDLAVTALEKFTSKAEEEDALGGPLKKTIQSAADFIGCVEVLKNSLVMTGVLSARAGERYSRQIRRAGDRADEVDKAIAIETTTRRILLEDAAKKFASAASSSAITNDDLDGYFKAHEETFTEERITAAVNSAVVISLQRAGQKRPAPYTDAPRDPKKLRGDGDRPTSNRPCMFYLTERGCLKGDRCDFRHDAPKKKNEKEKGKEEKFLDAEEKAGPSK